MYTYTHTHTHIYMHTYILYLSTMQKNKILPFATTWMELECIMLSEISKTEKDRYYDFTSMWNLRNKTDEHRGRKGKIRQKQRGRGTCVAQSVKCLTLAQVTISRFWLSFCADSSEPGRCFRFCASLSLCPFPHSHLVSLSKIN